MNLAYVDQLPTPGATQKLHAAFDAFADLDPQAVGAENNGGWEWFLRLELAAHARFVAWLQAENFPARENPDFSTALRSHLGKFPKLVLVLALIVHLVDLVQQTPGAPPGDPQGSISQLTPIALSAIERAIDIARYAKQHARRAYHAGADPAYTFARRLAQRIVAGDLSGTAKARLIARNCWSGLTDVDRVSDGLGVLEDFGWVRRRELRSSPRGGRPSMEWAINPLGLGATI